MTRCWTESNFPLKGLGVLLQFVMCGRACICCFHPSVVRPVVHRKYVEHSHWMTKKQSPKSLSISAAVKSFDSIGGLDCVIVSYFNKLWQSVCMSNCRICRLSSFISRVPLVYSKLFFPPFRAYDFIKIEVYLSC